MNLNADTYKVLDACSRAAVEKLWAAVEKLWAAVEKLSEQRLESGFYQGE